MKIFTLILGCMMISAYTPFAQDGSVTSDSMILEERLEKAHQNRLEEEKAERVIERNKELQEQQEDIPISRDKSPELNEAEKMVR